MLVAEDNEVHVSAASAWEIAIKHGLGKLSLPLPEGVRFPPRVRVSPLVIGGLAVGVVGEARTTGDVDVVGFASPEDAESLIAKAAAAGFEVRPEVEQERLRATGTLRFRHGPFQLDIILASLPFEEAAYSRAVSKRLFGRLVPLPTPEDLILLDMNDRERIRLRAVLVRRGRYP